MGWIGIADRETTAFSIRGLTRSAETAPERIAADGLMRRGSLVIETRLPTSRRPQPLLYCDRKGERPFHLSLQAIPGGGLSLVLNQGREVLHRAINHSQAGRMDVMRITYSWEVATGLGRLALERTDRDDVLLAPILSPQPLRIADARALIADTAGRYVAPDVLFHALSSDIEPVGPMPSLAGDTPIATPRGYVPVRALKRGDTVLTAEGRVVPVLHSLSRTVPARGNFRPLRLRAPYFGLQQDIVVAPSQRLVLSGSEVEYLFNQEAVLVEVNHLVGGTAVVPARAGATVSYTQLLLPEHEAVIAAGATVETLYVGRLRRRKEALHASVLAGLDRHTLPEHGKPLYPVLRAFDAIVLAEQRAA